MHRGALLLRVKVKRSKVKRSAVARMTPSFSTVLSWYKLKTCRMVSMLCLTFSFFLTEIIFGYVTNSLALIGDSYHMLSDVMALCVGLTSLRVRTVVCVCVCVCVCVTVCLCLSV